MGEITKEKLNGIDTEALKQVMGQVSKDPSVGKVKFKVTTTWKGTTKLLQHITCNRVEYRAYF